jgi:hypothetical protein
MTEAFGDGVTTTKVNSDVDTRSVICENNDHGLGVEIQNIVHTHPVPVEGLNGLRVVDYDIGENLAVALTEDGRVWWWGLRLVWSPRPLELATKAKVTRVVCGKDGFGVLTGKSCNS